MMSTNKKSYSYIFIIVLIIIIGVVLFFIFRNNGKTDNNSMNNEAKLALDSNVLGNNDKTNEIANKIENAVSTPKEEELSSFSTDLGSSPEGRLTNIRITCSKLNGCTVAKGETFSFCGTIGPSTAEDGYKEASIFVNGETVQALGGGNCQVSSTLYNAVLAVPDLEVKERHAHGKKVSYVPEGKDAAVSYGSVDLKFKNNTANDIKMYFSTDDKTVTVRIVKLV